MATKREGESALPAAPAAPFFFSLAARPAGRPATQSPGTRRCREQGRAGPRSGEGDRDPWPPTPVTPERRGETHLGESNCSSGHDKCRPRSLVFLTLSLPRPPRRLSLPQPFARHSCPARSVCEQRPAFLVSSPTPSPGCTRTRPPRNKKTRKPSGGCRRGTSFSHAMPALYLLYESAHGYALLEAYGLDAIGGTSVDGVQKSVTELDRFGKVRRKKKKEGACGGRRRRRRRARFLVGRGRSGGRPGCAQPQCQSRREVACCLAWSHAGEVGASAGACPPAPPFPLSASRRRPARPPFSPLDLTPPPPPLPPLSPSHLIRSSSSSPSAPLPASPTRWPKLTPSPNRPPRPSWSTSWRAPSPARAAPKRTKRTRKRPPPTSSASWTPSWATPCRRARPSPASPMTSSPNSSGACAPTASAC